MRHEVPSKVGAQYMDTSGCQLSDLNDVAFYWENDQMDVDVVFRPGVNRPFASSKSNDFEIGSMAKNPVVIDEEEEKENFPPLSTTSVSEKAAQQPVLRKSCPFGTRSENVSDFVYRNSFEDCIISLLYMFLNINFN